MRNDDFADHGGTAPLAHLSRTLRRSVSLPMATDSSAKTDAPPRSLDRQVVLEEDEYAEALSHIIARDFFPSLVHLDATNNYLDALKSQDPGQIQATVRRLEEINTPLTNRRSTAAVGATPTPYGGRGTYDTPLRTPYGSDRYGDDEGGEPLPKKRKFDTGMSLDNFQAKYTSEDNASFLEILDDENKKRRETYGWAYDAQKRVEEQRERMLEGREKLLIEPPQVSFTGVREKLMIEASKPVGLVTQGESEDAEGKEVVGKEVAVISVTKDEEAVDVMAPKKDTREAGVDGWRFKVSFLFGILRPRVLSELLGEKCSYVCSRCRRIPTYRKERFWNASRP